MLNITKSIKLVPFSIEQANNFFNLIYKNRSFLRKRLAWLDDTKSVDDTKKFLISSITSNSKGLSLNYFIRYQDDIIGTIGLRNISSKSAIVGYWIDEHYQGKGIITFSLKKVLNICKENKITQKIILRCPPDNIASCKVAKKCDFKYIKTLKDAENLYGIFNDLDVYELNL